MNDQAKPKFLKCLKNGRVFDYTDLLAKRDDMIPCDVNGHIIQGHISESTPDGGSERVRTKYLGNPVNGVLFPYTNVLATRDDLVGVNTPEEWDEYMKARDGNAVIEVLPGGKTAAPEPAAEEAPVLGRAEPEQEVAADVSRETETASNQEEKINMPDQIEPPELPDPKYVLPDTAGMGAREAKTLLSDWAEKHYGHKLDRRPALDVVMAEAEALITGQAAAAG